VNPKVPSLLSAIVARAMARVPGDRFPSARHLSMELRNWLDLPEASALVESPEAARRRRLKLLGIGIGAAALVAVVQSAWRPWGGVEETPAAEPVVAAASAPAAGDAQAAHDAASAASAAAGVVDDAASSAAAIAAPEPASAAVVAEAPKPKPTTTRDKKRTAAAPVAPAEAPPAAPPPSPGVVQLAVSPWGQVEVDGAPVGIAPPLNRLSLPAGSHTITIRNGELPPLVRTVEVSADRPVVIKHRFEQ
jgi:serine/threonine-protein kinase